ncbi:DUF6300 family protein [Streptomyces sp. NPDC091377]|uniref:DUF6300 family protein n=1 Tax=Streptomyces sp. NPDC091377 TaxID=3365995 RepID=UPI003823BFA6
MTHGPGPRRSGTRTLELRFSTTPPCPRCTAPAVLLARHPHTWHNRSGTPVEGLRETLLCGTCDADDPAAKPLLALVTGDPARLRPERLAALVPRWLEALRHRAPL